jgi:AraC family transcriptional regulator of adaptative response / DNA-3-methyladenine glycosylase II
MSEQSLVKDPDGCYRALESRDPRFDGLFVTAVTTTGIYCRPSCPARTPKREHVRFYPGPAMAEAAGFRPCKRCHPNRAPGSPDWQWRGDVAARAVRLIAEGVVDREGVRGLAQRLYYTPRQLQRHLTAELGVSPLRLARARRLETARLLLETTSLSVTEIAWASGYRSLRQFHKAVQVGLRQKPGELRRTGARQGPGQKGSAVTVQLPFRTPFDSEALWRFLAERAVPGVEEAADAGHYRRVLALPHGYGIAEVDLTSSQGATIPCRFWLADWRDMGPAVAGIRRLLDLDADPQRVALHLSQSPLLVDLVARRPGLRVPGHPDPHELAIRAVIGQQISVSAARTVAAQLARRWGAEVEDPTGGLTRRFPSVETLAAANPDEFPMPRARARALHGLAEQLAHGRLVLDAGSDRDEASRRLAALPGIGPWTVQYIRMRGLGDPDAFPATDLGVRRVLARRAQPAGDLASAALGESWRPWRAYAVMHLWTDEWREDQNVR